MKFYLTLTDQDGVLIDRFRLELPTGENPEDETVSEDSEAVGSKFTNLELCERLLRDMRFELKQRR